MAMRRKEKYYFDFFEESKIIENMSSYFKVNKDKVKKYFNSVEEVDISDFIKNFNINLNSYDSREVFIKCKHLTTSNDELKSFKQYGLINLRKVLTLKTPLKNFLEENSIDIDVENKIFSYEGIKYKIISHEDECDKCFYGNCKYRKDILGDSSKLIYRDMSCGYRKVITNLYVKLYKDRAETEVFISGNNEEITEYSIINKCPEILLTIDNIMKKISNNYSDLQSKWEYSQKGVFYILEFYTNIKNFEFINTSKLYEGYSFIDDIKEYFDIDDEARNNSDFYRNLFLLQNSIYCYYGYPKEYGQLYPETKILFENVKVNGCKRDNYDKH